MSHSPVPHLHRRSPRQECPIHEGAGGRGHNIWIDPLSLNVCSGMRRRKKPIADMLKGPFFTAEIDGEFNPSEFQVVKLLGSGKSSKVTFHS